MFDDVPRFLARRDHGLGRYSEQSIEAIHGLEYKKWQNYKTDIANKNYSSQPTARRVLNFDTSNKDNAEPAAKASSKGEPKTF